MPGRSQTLALIGRGLAAHQAQQRRLALAVAPHQAEAFPAGDLEFRPLQQGVMAEGEGNLVEGDSGMEKSGQTTVFRARQPVAAMLNDARKTVVCPGFPIAFFLVEYYMFIIRPTHRFLRQETQTGRAGSKEHNR